MTVRELLAELGKLPSDALDLPVECVEIKYKNWRFNRDCVELS